MQLKAQKSMEDSQLLVYLAYKKRRASPLIQYTSGCLIQTESKLLPEISKGSFETINESNFHLNERQINL